MMLGRQARQGRPNIGPDPLLEAAHSGDGEMVRKIIQQRLRRLAARLQADHDDSEAGFTARRQNAAELARRMGRTSASGQELLNAMIEAFDLKDVPDQPAPNPTPLRGRTAVIQAAAAGAHEVVDEEVVEAVAAALGMDAEDVNTARVRAELAGTSRWNELLDAMSVRHAQRLAAAAPAESLARAVRAVSLAQLGTWMLLFMVVPFDPDRSAIVREVLADPMWRFCQALPPPRQRRGGDLVTARWAPALALAAPFLAELERFGNRLLEIGQATVLAGHLPT